MLLNKISTNTVCIFTVALYLKRPTQLVFMKVEGNYLYYFNQELYIHIFISQKIYSFKLIFFSEFTFNLIYIASISNINYLGDSYRIRSERFLIVLLSF